MRKRDYNTISEECLKELTQVEHIQPCQSHTEGLMRGSYYHYLSLFLPLHLAQCWAVYTVVPSKCFFNLNVYCCRWELGMCELTLRRFLKLNLANISTFARAPELAPSTATLECGGLLRWEAHCHPSHLEGVERSIRLHVQLTAALQHPPWISPCYSVVSHVWHDTTICKLKPTRLGMTQEGIKTWFLGFLLIRLLLCTPILPTSWHIHPSAPAKVNVFTTSCHRPESLASLLL